MKIVKCITKDQLIDHYTIRKIVFIDEQNVSYEDEFDLLEKSRIPFVLYDNDKPIGAARLNIQNNYTKIERMCILSEYRAKGLGKLIMNYLIDYSNNLGVQEVLLSAQVQALGFYESLGFTKFGDEFLDANIPHYKMKKNLL